ncbi:hypothetical protein [Flavobacterium collinsii]|uniref:hypothetical protein n=1 Tax=Flavobacterium collinsii TaxID=1114861 RepID=UPI002492A87A|nr:hypothetical protein [Flavobacterium collinsii]
MKNSITKRIVKYEFTLAEENLEFCWNVLADFKTLSVKENNFVERLLIFQEKLATTIIRLQSIRSTVVTEEEYCVKNKKKFNQDWFRSRMKLLSTYKKGIDSVINMSKSFGDAFAYFFYQFDQELLNKHLNHQRIVNHTVDIGKRGELEFIKNIKHLEGHFTLFHDMTNILRYGDFSFINLRTLKIEKIGELKTKKVDSQTLNLSLTFFKRSDFKKRKEEIKNRELEKTRVGRQILGIANLLVNVKEENDEKKKLFNPTYSKEVEKLILSTKPNDSQAIQVSNGLAFSLLKTRKTSLFHNIFYKDFIKNGIKEKFNENYTEVVKKLIKKDSDGNGIIIGQLLYNPDLTTKNTPGTVPLFWHPINIKALKQLYFLNTIVISLFNPLHLISEIENMGFHVDSKYSKKKVEVKQTKGVQNFDRFISYIINFLMTEEFVLESVKGVEENYKNHGNAKILIKPQQKFDIIPPFEDNLTQ